ncbi:GNAT family N-acetyltransferase [Flammeovirga sp. SubArs3]|uniref:GNAT family N-acetyltransferase n=1 Tax=Flammeovirga sp. SubArs3 TaxID=2995316 RepID=UPI00248D0EC8|nr:GNAT family N-acetyltransferase [Flammeovirga sp. SubArs3]
MTSEQNNFKIETERLLLTEFSIDDARPFYDMNNDTEVMKYTGDHPFISVDEAKKFILQYTAYNEFKMGRWTVRRKSDNAYLGWCGLKLHPDTKEVDLGFRLIRKYWNKGYATEAGLSCLEWGKSQNINKIIARCHHENIASQKVIAKLGFQFLKSFEENQNEWYQYQIEF